MRYLSVDACRVLWSSEHIVGTRRRGFNTAGLRNRIVTLERRVFRPVKVRLDSAAFQLHIIIIITDLLRRRSTGAQQRLTKCA